MDVRRSNTMVDAVGHGRFLLFFVCLLLLLWVYVRHYWTLPHETYVLQTGVENFGAHVLRERQPVVLEDRVVDVRQLCRVALAHHYVSDKMWWAQNGQEILTAAMVTMISPNGPKNEDEKCVLVATCLASTGCVVEFRLRSGQILMLPAHWRVSVPPDGPPCRVVEAYDVLHLLCFPVRLAKIEGRR